MENEKYIIVEVIPEALSPEKGSIVQLSALKIEGFKLLGRFDYRLSEDKIKNKDLLKIISYDINDFKYVDDDKMIIDDFIKWSSGFKLLIIDNFYTEAFLKDVSNEKVSVFKFLGLEYSDDVMEKVITKYGLQPSNYIVDLLYEALIYESNNK